MNLEACKSLEGHVKELRGALHHAESGAPAAAGVAPAWLPILAQILAALAALLGGGGNQPPPVPGPPPSPPPAPAE